MRITIDKLSSTLISFKYFVIKVQTWTGVITIFKIQGSNLVLVRLSVFLPSRYSVIKLNQRLRQVRIQEISMGCKSKEVTVIMIFCSMCGTMHSLKSGRLCSTVYPSIRTWSINQTNFLDTNSTRYNVRGNYKKISKY